jgi:hypothetical protein
MSRVPDGVPAGIFLVDSITKLDARHRDAVVVSGSHGGIYAGYCAAKGRLGIMELWRPQPSSKPEPSAR